MDLFVLCVSIVAVFMVNVLLFVSVFLFVGDHVLSSRAVVPNPHGSIGTRPH